MAEGSGEAGAEGAVGRLGTVVLIFKRLLLPEEDQAIEAESFMYQASRARSEAGHENSSLIMSRMCSFS